jgi:hypothetical protein
MAYLSRWVVGSTTSYYTKLANEASSRRDRARRLAEQSGIVQNWQQTKRFIAEFLWTLITNGPWQIQPSLKITFLNRWVVIVSDRG